MKEVKQDWLTKIERAEKHFFQWRQNGKEITQRFRGRSSNMGEDKVDFNLHHANAQLYISMVYPKTPKPVTRRRWMGNPRGIPLADTLQAALQFTVNAYDIDEQIEMAMVDYYNAAMGVVRLHYVPYYDFQKKKIRVFAGDDGSFVTEEGKTVAEPQQDADGFYVFGPKEKGDLAHEEVQFEFVPWDRFGYDPDALTWDDVEWTYIRHSFSEAQVEELFGKAAKNKLEWGESRDEDTDGDKAFIGRRAKVYEVFDKVGREQLFITGGGDSSSVVLERNEDPWSLEGFFPHPQPMMGVVTSDNMTPVPQYQILEPLYQELDETQARIFEFASALKIRGAYNAQFGDEFSKIMNGGNGGFIPVDNWNALTDGNKTADSNIWTFPINDFVAALNTMAGHRNTVRQQIDEITPFFDAARGGGRVDESAAMTKTKTRYSDARINREVKKVNKFCRDLYRLAGEMICELFTPKTLSNITGDQVSDQDMVLLRDDFARALLVDVEIDQDAFEVDQGKRRDLMEFMNALNTALGAAQGFQAMGFSGDYSRSIFKKALQSYPEFRDMEVQFDQEPNALAPPPPQPADAGPGSGGGEGGQPPAGPPA